MRYCYINGLYKNKTEAKVSIEDRGFNLSDGVYEVMSFLNHNLINFSKHISRLGRSLESLKIKMPFKNTKSLELIIKRLIHINKLKSGFLYLQITRGSAKRNHLFPKSTKPNIVIFLFSLKYDEKIFDKGVNICLTEDIRWGRCDIKSISLLPNVLEKQKAFENGFFETWQIKNNLITEGATSNAFIVNKKNEIQTHPSNNFILGGVTRDTMIEVAKNNNFKIKEKAFTVDELFDSKEAFLTSTTAKILPVVNINKKKVNNGKPGDITQILIKKYNEFLKLQVNE